MSLLGRPMNECLIIDNSPTRYTFLQYNALPILFGMMIRKIAASLNWYPCWKVWPRLMMYGNISLNLSRPIIELISNEPAMSWPTLCKHRTWLQRAVKSKERRLCLCPELASIARKTRMRISNNIIIVWLINPRSACNRLRSKSYSIHPHVAWLMIFSPTLT